MGDANKVERLAKLLSGYKLNAADERTLQDQIEAVLTKEGTAFQREHELSDLDRIDFLVETIGIEVKINSSPAQVLRQLFRYSEHKDIDGLLLVTTRSRHTNLPPELNGVPVRVLYLVNSFL